MLSPRFPQSYEPCPNGERSSYHYINNSLIIQLVIGLIESDNMKLTV
jgi:hypothetical protein